MKLPAIILAMLLPLAMRDCGACYAAPLHSLPGAAHTLTLSFDGDPQHNTPAWGTEAQRLEVWQRVSEKYSPFDVDVTTVPGGLRIIIGGDGAWTGQALGGIYQGVTGYVFPANLATVANVGEAAAHEAGHVEGLNHQSLYPGGFQFVAYNPGDALRAPIMGVSYYAQRGIWWRGQSSAYSLLDENGNLYGPEQDDVAVLAAALGLAADDHPGPSSIVGTVTGIIGMLDDRDGFTFHAAGQTSLVADVAALGPTLDLRLDLYDSGGELVASADTAALGERIDVTLPDGDYLAVVGSHGGYGDLGTYSLSVVPEPGAVWVGLLLFFSGMRRRLLIPDLRLVPNDVRDAVLSLNPATRKIIASPMALVSIPDGIREQFDDAFAHGADYIACGGK